MASQEPSIPPQCGNRHTMYVHIGTRRYVSITIPHICIHAHGFLSLPLSLRLILFLSFFPTRDLSLSRSVSLSNTCARTIHNTSSTLQHTATHCNAQQHAATHYHTLQHTATHCNTLQHTATHCNVHCNIHYNTQCKTHSNTHTNFLSLSRSLSLSLSHTHTHTPLK